MILDGIEKDQTIWIVGAGSSLTDYPKTNFKSGISIGINNVPIETDYHLWTNRKRWSEFGKNAKPKKSLIIGEGISHENIRKFYQGSYVKLNYKDEPGLSLKYDGEVIYGHFRTAGCLAIMLAHVMGANKIYVIGMDGYTLHSREDLDSGAAAQHAYGRGFTDDASWKDCLEKDRQVGIALDAIKEAGIEFKIVTPTVFKDHYCAG